MPLPDADKKSPRVYTLSQNTDLENIAFATLQSIGQPINIEEMNEDELRRLVLVNLARLAVKGEWSGLLDAGGGDFNPVLLEDVIDSAYVRYVVNAYPPYGSSTTTSQNFSTSTTNDKCFFWPFLAPESGDIAEIGIDIIVASTSSNDIQVGVYSSAATTGAPDTLLGKAVLDSQSTGAVYDTSLTSTVTLVKGTQYWIGFCRSTTAINVTFRGISKAYMPAFSTWNAPNINGKGVTLRLDNGTLSLPAGSITLTDFVPQDYDNPAISMKIT
jgi:hypothetical protein